MSEFDPVIHERMIAKRNKEKALADQAEWFRAENAQEIKHEINRRTEEKHAKFESHFGTFGRYILEAGDGGGFTAIPHAIDMYQAALGLSIKEAWYMKLICRYLPNIFPSMSGIAKRTGIREAELSKIKKGLLLKGFVRDYRAPGGRLQRELNIMPFFTAVAICILCDADSSVTKNQVRDKVRTAFTADVCGREDAAFRAKLEDFGAIELPLGIDAAQELAKMYGVTLNWTYIYKNLQSVDSLEKLENMSVDKKRMLEVKEAIKSGSLGAFNIVYFPGKGRGYEWLKWLCNLPVKLEEIEKLTTSYIEQAEQPTAKEYMQWMKDFIESGQNKGILAEREVYRAEVKASKRLEGMYAE